MGNSNKDVGAPRFQDRARAQRDSAGGINNSGRGNPYHDGLGKFTTAGKDGSGNVNPVSSPKAVSTGSHATTVGHGTKKFRRDHAEMDRSANAQMRKILQGKMDASNAKARAILSSPNFNPNANKPRR